MSASKCHVDTHEHPNKVGGLDQDVCQVSRVPDQCEEQEQETKNNTEHEREACEHCGFPQMEKWDFWLRTFRVGDEYCSTRAVTMCQHFFVMKVILSPFEALLDCVEQV